MSVRGRGGGVKGRLLTLLTWGLTAFMFFPVYWMVVTSLKAEKDAYTDPPTFAFWPTIEQYVAVLSRDFVPYLVNSLVASLISVVGVMLLAIPTAYSLSFRTPRARGSITFFYISTRLMPAAGVIIPLYLLAREIGLLDHIAVLIIMYTAINLPIGVWMLTSFFDEMPRELFEAAKVDGANVFQEVSRILMPIAMPGVASAALICFIFAWNEFFLAVNLTATMGATVPVYLSGFISGRGLFWAKLAAAATLACLPPVIAGWTAQKQLVQGLAMGAVK